MHPLVPLFTETSHLLTPLMRQHGITIVKVRWDQDGTTPMLWTSRRMPPFLTAHDTLAIVKVGAPLLTSLAAWPLLGALDSCVEVAYTVPNGIKDAYPTLLVDGHIAGPRVDACFSTRLEALLSLETRLEEAAQHTPQHGPLSSWAVTIHHFSGFEQRASTFRGVRACSPEQAAWKLAALRPHPLGGPCASIVARTERVVVDNLA
jgi:hypothetical protein